jgi:hypothetical protein
VEQPNESFLGCTFSHLGFLEMRRFEIGQDEAAGQEILGKTVKMFQKYPTGSNFCFLESIFK